MKDSIRDNARLIVVVLLIIVGFVAVIQSGKGDSPEDTAEADTYTQVNVSSAMTKGDEAASIEMIQYSDFLCPSCSYLSTQIMPSIEQNYIDAGTLSFEFRPMAFIADGSITAAEGAYCAIDQELFWPYHDAVYTYVWENAFSKGIDPKSVTILTSDIIKSIAADVGVDQTTFDDCLDSREHADKVDASNQAARLQGITGTPYVLLDGDDISSSATNLTALEALIEAKR